MSLLVEASAKIDLKDHINCSALTYAVDSDAFECAQLLVAKGADVNLVDSDSRSLLWKAYYNDVARIAQLLMRAGASLESMSKHEAHQLMEAIQAMGSEDEDVAEEINSD